MLVVGKDLSRRLERLEENALPADLPEWPVEDQIDDVLEALRVHRMGGTAHLATDRELQLVAMVCSGEEVAGEVRPEDLPEGVREHFERMSSDEQPARERWLHANWSAAKERREHWRCYFSDEQVRARREESKQRDRELLERNREHVERMDAARQAERERYLYEHRGEGA